MGAASLGVMKRSGGEALRRASQGGINRDRFFTPLLMVIIGSAERHLPHTAFLMRAETAYRVAGKTFCCHSFAPNVEVGRL